MRWSATLHVAKWLAVLVHERYHVRRFKDLDEPQRYLLRIFLEVPDFRGYPRTLFIDARFLGRFIEENAHISLRPTEFEQNSFFLAGAAGQRRMTPQRTTQSTVAEYTQAHVGKDVDLTVMREKYKQLRRIYVGRY